MTHDSFFTQSNLKFLYRIADPKCTMTRPLPLFSLIRPSLWLVLYHIIQAPQLTLGQLKYPHLILFPLHTFQDHRQLFDKKSLQQKTQTLLTQKFATSWQSMESFLSTKQGLAPLNLLKQAKDFQIATQSVLSASNLLFEVHPTLCPIASQWMIFISIVEPQSQSILSMSHQIVPSLDDQPLTAALLTASDLVISQALTPKPSSFIKLMIQPAKAQSNLSQPNHDCLNLLLSYSLHQKYQVLQSYNQESSLMAHRLLALNREPSKPNYQVLPYWFHPRQPSQASELISFDFYSHSAHSVFADHIKKDPLETISLSNLNNQYQLSPSLSLMTRLDNFNSQLDPTIMPKVVKIKGAWAYLDKGRSWGLEMSDRMISNLTPSSEGHIVNFYGPEQNLIDQNGHPILDGAILYIRRHQNKIRLDQTFIFDPKTYPTPSPF